MSHATSETNLAEHRLRTDLYNATVKQLRWLHNELVIVRVSPDLPIRGITAGQYTTLGLGNWEQRVAGCQPEEPSDNVRPKLIKRAYSLSCPLLDAEGRLQGVNCDDGTLEFYIALVREAGHAPALTPRLFMLHEGDRLFCGTHPHGHYTVAPVLPSANVVLASTGTGEAPHNAMAVELLKRGHEGRIVAINCVRRRHDLGYLAEHRRLEQLAANYQYVPLTTREPENLDPNHSSYCGKRYIQQYLESGDFEAETGVPLNPESTHVFLCGNPSMIGLPLRDRPASATTAVLLAAGFEIDRPQTPGNIHFEKYW